MSTSELITTVIAELEQIKQSLAPESALVDMRDVPQPLPAEYGTNVARALREDMPGQTFTVKVPTGKKPLWFAAWLLSSIQPQLEGLAGEPQVSVGFDGTVTVRLDVEDWTRRPNYPAERA